MTDGYKTAVAVVMKYMEDEEYSTTVVWTHKSCAKQLEDYLDKEDLPCTKEVVETWLKDNSRHWSPSKLKAFKIASGRILGVMEVGHVSASIHSHRDSGFYEGLPAWAKEEVDSYINAFSPSNARATVKYEKVCCSHFLHYLVDAGVVSVSEISLELIIDYQQQGCETSTTRARRMSAARGLLMMVRDRGEIPAWAVLLMSDLYSTHMDSYRAVFGIAGDKTSGLSPEGFLELAENLIAQELPQARYCPTSKKIYSKALRMLYIFLALNGLCYSFGTAIEWVCANKDQIGSSWKGYRRAIFLFQGFKTEGSLKPDAIFKAKPDLISELPEWSKDELRAYIQVRKRECCAQSTIDCIRNACKRFIMYVDERGIRGYGDLDATIVSSFCLNDPHLTPEGRFCYVSKVRAFLEHLADIGLVRYGLTLAADPAVAPKGRLVKTLTDEQQKMISKEITAAKAPMDLRNAAMVAIGLTMGLRASDIATLKLEDLLWERSSIRFYQQKTGVEVTLPLAILAGNAIVEYLRHGRPQCSSRYLFVKHRAPYSRLHRSACGKALKKVLGVEHIAFHILRRTFATSMLRAGVGRNVIAEALGHASDRSVHSYLSLDEVRIAKCALSLKECGILPGGHHA